MIYSALRRRRNSDTEVLERGTDLKIPCFSDELRSEASTSRDYIPITIRSETIKATGNTSVNGTYIKLLRQFSNIVLGDALDGLVIFSSFSLLNEFVSQTTVRNRLSRLRSNMLTSARGLFLNWIPFLELFQNPF